MPLEFYYSDPQGVEEPTVSVSLSSNTVRFGTLQITQAASLGEPGMSGLEVDDPDGIYNFVGLRGMTIRETAAGSNNDVLIRARIQDRKVTRADSSITSNARRWSLDLVDYSWHLGSRVLTDADAKRPAETAGDRIRWLLSDAAHINLYDLGHVTYPTNQVDAADYRGQRVTDLLADCAVELGYNYWCDWAEAQNKVELWFMHPGSVTYASSISISNVPSDINYVSVFPPDDGATLTRSASRIAFGVYLAHANGSVYRRNQTTGEQFAKVDQTAPMANVKTAARATRIADKFLADNDTEDDTITCSIWLPPHQVNDLRHGHLVFARFLHFPGYETAQPMRVVRRTIVQDPETGAYRGSGENIDADDHEGWYRMDLELSPATDYPREDPVPPVSCGIDEADAFAATYNDGDPDSSYLTGPTLSLVSGKQYRLVVEVDYVVRPRIEAISTLEVNLNRYPGGNGSFSPSPSNPWLFQTYPAQGQTYYSDWYTYSGGAATGWIETHIGSVWSPGQACNFRVYVECV